MQIQRTFYQLSRHQEEQHMGTHLHYAKLSQVQETLRHLPHSGFQKIKQNRKIEKTAKKLVRMAIFQHFVFQTFGNLFHSPYQRNWRMRRYNSSQVTFANSIPFSEYVFFCKLIFRVFCYS